MWDEPNVELKCQNVHSYRYQKRCWLIQTEGRWPWKLESAKECVTTHLPNQLALKMDGAKVYYLYSTFWTNLFYVQKSRRAWSFLSKPMSVSLGGRNSSADLGCSSKYSSEILEGRSRERFRMNSIWIRVSRS